MTTEYASLREKIAAEKIERAERYARFEKVWMLALEAGSKAFDECVPRVMTVTSGGHEYRVEDGPCGFAWVKLVKGNTSFAKWASKKGIFRRSYNGGMDHWIGGMSQSHDRKRAMAQAIANTLQRELDLQVYAGSRLD